MDAMLDSFGRQMNTGRMPTENQYAHSQWLLETSESDVLNKFTQICDKDVSLANIKDDELLRLFQNDIEILTHSLAMAGRCPALAPAFNYMVYSFKGSLRITRAKGGWERGLQGGPGVGVRLTGKQGSDGLQMQVTPEDDAQAQNFLSSLFKRKNMKGQDGGQ